MINPKAAFARWFHFDAQFSPKLAQTMISSLFLLFYFSDVRFLRQVCIDLPGVCALHATHQRAADALDGARVGVPVSPAWWNEPGPQTLSGVRWFLRPKGPLPFPESQGPSLQKAVLEDPVLDLTPRWTAVFMFRAFAFDSPCPLQLEKATWQCARDLRPKIGRRSKWWLSF